MKRDNRKRITDFAHRMKVEQVAMRNILKPQFELIQNYDFDIHVSRFFAINVNMAFLVMEEAI